MRIKAMDISLADYDDGKAQGRYLNAALPKLPRIFPLVALGGTPSSLVESLTEHAHSLECLLSIEAVPYEFQRGGNKMMRITR